MCGPVHYTGESRFTTATGILDPFISCELNIAMYWHVLQGREILKAGTPILQIIPIPRNLIIPEPISSEGTDKQKISKSLINLSVISAFKDYFKFKELTKRLWKN